MGENSTSSAYPRAWVTAFTAMSKTSERLLRICRTRCASEVPTKVWMRGRGASFRASPARSMSFGITRDRAQIAGPSTSSPMRCTASKSSLEETGKPASMTSTRSRASCWAISSLSRRVSDAPGDCSASLRVVSKMMTRSSDSARAMSITPSDAGWRFAQDPFPAPPSQLIMPRRRAPTSSIRCSASRRLRAL